MEFEDQEHEEELAMAGASYDDSVVNPTRAKLPTPVEEPVLFPTRNCGKNGRYRECLKNHAVSIGGHALDGCGEFLASGADGTLDALKCAACNCHRNFHRKETDITASAVSGDPFLLPYHHHHHQHRRHNPAAHLAAYYRAPTGYLHVAGQQRGTATLALPSTSGGVGVGGGTQSRRDEHEEFVAERNGSGSGSGSSKKRFRTKFTQEQKEKMLGLAERLGWRIQKQDEGLVQEFCSQTGLNRHVLKVWMHNNKHTLGKKP